MILYKYLFIVCLVMSQIPSNSVFVANLHSLPSNSINENTRIDKITGNHVAKQTSYNPTLFEGYVIGDTETENLLTLEGSGFGLEGTGATKGTLNIVCKDIQINKIISWTNTKIIFTIRVGYNAQPRKATVNLKTSGVTGQNVSHDFKIAPSVGAHQFGECTWWVAKRRREFGKTIPSPIFTDSKYKNINEFYEPMKHDIWKFTDSQLAFIEKINVKRLGNSKRPILKYEIDLSESNPDKNGQTDVWSKAFIEIEHISQNKRIIKTGYFGKSTNDMKATYFFR